MAQEQSPAFQFYPKDFLTDSNVMAMTLQEVGAYTRLLCLCWLEGSLPTQMDSLSRLCRVSTVCFSRIWPALAPCFEEVAGRLVQPRIERERNKQKAYRAMKAAAGKQGGRPKAEAKQGQSRSKANESPPSSSSSSSSVSDLQPSVQVPSSADADSALVGPEKKARKNRRALMQTDAREAPTAFAGFWACYPRKVGKAAAVKVWDALNPSQETINQMVEALQWQIQQPQWVKENGQFIPHPTTWLRQARWLDEPVPRTGAKL